MDDKSDPTVKTPKFTDSHRFSVPYIRAEKTNIAATFERIRQQQKEAVCQQPKVKTIRLR